jgi:hypothetical protein
VTPPVLVAQAPAGIPATAVPARTRGDLSVVALVAPPHGRPAVDLPLDILAELGKRDDVAGRSSHSQDDTALIPIWLTAHATAWLVVTSPHVLPVPALQLLATLALPAGSTLLLACDHGTAPVVLDGLADYGPAQLDWNRVPEFVPPLDAVAAPTSAKKAVAPQEWTERDLSLPVEDWPTFRYECRRLLHPDTFAKIDAVYVAAFRAARAWLRRNQPTEEAAAALLGSIIGSTASLDHAITALRACQAAHMEAGWFLRADLQQAISAISQKPAVLTDQQWLDLRAYRDPHRPAAVVLHQHGLTVAAMHQLTLDGIALDGSTAGPVSIDPRGRVYLRAQALRRLADGAARSDPLFPDEPRRTVNAIRAARGDLSLKLGPGRLSENENPADRWQRRLGLALWDLR